jgi:glycosyltransferase involved in cell wall biosynthesis
MKVLHLVTLCLYPAPGGMYESVLRIGRSLAQCGFEVIVYTLGQPIKHRGPSHEHNSLRVVHLSQESDFILEPFLADGAPPQVLEDERSRVKVLRLRNQISRQMQDRPNDQHVIISFYASGTGYLTQHVASGLGLPHIAAVRGTDFACDLVSQRGHPRVRFVMENAAQVVTTNQEQADTISAMFRLQRPIRTIHNSIPDVDRQRYWKPEESDVVRFIADSGFSGRKGTHLLIRAVQTLLDNRLPVSLTILGGTYELDDHNYWEERRRGCEERYPGAFYFPGHRPPDEIDDYLIAAHVYCSATLAEGCSLSRIRALTLGIPITTTRCGALPEVASNCSHIQLCTPGDWQELSELLEAAAAKAQANSVGIDREQIENWRRHFSEDRECEEWRAAIDGAT